MCDRRASHLKVRLSLWPAWIAVTLLDVSSTLSCAPRLQKRQSRSFKFDHPGNVPLLCNIHPEMTGTLIVAPTPYFAQTDQILVSLAHDMSGLIST